jgi:hypothetical protein
VKLLDRIKAANKETETIRKELNKISEYYDVPYNEMYQYYSIMKPKQAEKFIEGWVAQLIGGGKINSRDVPDEYRQNDNGDIWAGSTLKIGNNNIELKSSFKGTTIGGGQFRFYENVPYYMLFKAWDENNFDMFLLTKAQLIEEIKDLAKRPGKKSAYTSSQGSGVISKLSKDEQIIRLHENLAGDKADKIGWGFNAKTEKDLYAKFVTKYKVDPKKVKEIINGV